MAFTRYNYDSLRTQKKLQQSTGTCRYMLNVPGPFSEHCYMQDPQIRIQKFGANLMTVRDGHPIDIDSDLKGVGKKLKAGGPLKSIPAGNKGLPSLPTAVRNKMGFKKKGGKVQKRAGGGMALRGFGVTRKK